MDVKDLKRLLEAVKEAEVGELVLETGDYKLTVKRGGEVVTQSAQSAPAPQPAQPRAQPQQNTQEAAPSQEQQAAPTPAEPAQEAAPASNLDEVTAPIVGTFYAGPSPEAPDYVKVGAKVETGAVLVHHRSDEADERDRGGERGYDQRDSRQERGTCGVWAGSLPH